MTGRRFSEIMNGRSTFTPVEDQPFHARFTGQLKRKRDDESEMEDSENGDDGYESETYIIPLLVSYETFQKGWNALRQKQEMQDKKIGGETVQKLTNKQVSMKYQKNLKRVMDDHRNPLPLPKESETVPGDEPRRFKIHDLRSTYARYVETLFQSPHAYPFLAMQVLGHSDIDDSLSYSSITLENAHELRGKYGTFDP